MQKEQRKRLYVSNHSIAAKIRIMYDASQKNDVNLQKENIRRLSASQETSQCLRKVQTKNCVLLYSLSNRSSTCTIISATYLEKTSTSDLVV